MIVEPHYITSDPDILSGAPVFAGTRVPFAYLMEYLERGSDIDQFITDYPSVTRDQATKALSEASSVVEDFVHAHTA